MERIPGDKQPKWLIDKKDSMNKEELLNFLYQLAFVNVEKHLKLNKTIEGLQTTLDQKQLSYKTLEISNEDLKM